MYMFLLNMFATKAAVYLVWSCYPKHYLLYISCGVAFPTLLTDGSTVSSCSDFAHSSFLNCHNTVFPRHQ